MSTGSDAAMAEVDGGEIEPTGSGAMSSSPPIGGEPSVEGAHRARSLRLYLPALRMEFGRTCRMAIPMLVNNMANFAISIVVFTHVGHLGKHALASAALGSSLFNVLGMSLFIGCAATLETLCGQAVGAGKYKLVGLEMARCMLLLTASMPLFAALYAGSAPILVALGQAPETAHGAAAYLVRLTPGLWFLGMAECFKRSLTSRGIVLPNMLIAIFTLSCMPFYAWLYIDFLGLGYLGAAHAISTGYLSNMLCFAATSAVINWRKRGTREHAWPGWSWEMIRGFKGFIALAFPTTMMICLDWWCWEIMILLAGLLPDPEVSVGVMGLGFNVVSLFMMTPLATTCAAGVGVANFLGANQPRRARLAQYMGMALNTALMTTFCVLIYVLRHRIGHIYTDDVEVLAALDAVVPFISAILWVDAFQSICTAPLRGSGRQAIGAAVSVVVLWCFCVPLAATLGFGFKLALHGFWYALLVGYSCEAVILFATVTVLIDMDKEAQQAQLRMLERAATAAVTAPGIASLDEPLLPA
eukprot:jgi/Tetstr1/458398/TSEL_044835.t1